MKYSRWRGESSNYALIIQLYFLEQVNYCITRVSDQNGVSLLDIMLEIHHSGRESSIPEVPLTLFQFCYRTTNSKEKSSCLRTLFCTDVNFIFQLKHTSYVD